MKQSKFYRGNLSIIAKKTPAVLYIYVQKYERVNVFGQWHAPHIIGIRTAYPNKVTTIIPAALTYVI